ncbi:hypothetical protein RclHR1_20170004 [Rhizophagus clarus]|uniref:Uncharacterized protein n=1 Tax=Rhizophagus clarus TaxID=94130 RepID=A0A2Z6R474_9GLOM|nr:hypothetical protein RclHR1_20170004 [Rhizophagus clarus]
MITQGHSKFEKIDDFQLAIPLHEEDPSCAKEISNDISIPFLDSVFNFFVELEKSAFKSVVYSQGKGLELKHTAGLMNFSVPNIQVIEPAARRIRISESDNNNVVGYNVSFISPTNQFDPNIIKIGYEIRRFLPLIQKVPEIVPIFNNYGTNYRQIRESLLKYLEGLKDDDQFDYSKFPFCKRPNLEDFTLNNTNSISNKQVTTQSSVLTSGRLWLKPQYTSQLRLELDQISYSVSLPAPLKRVSNNTIDKYHIPWILSWVQITKGDIFLGLDFNLDYKRNAFLDLDFT